MDPGEIARILIFFAMAFPHGGFSHFVRIMPPRGFAKGSCASVVVRDVLAVPGPEGLRERRLHENPGKVRAMSTRKSAPNCRLAIMRGFS